MHRNDGFGFARRTNTRLRLDFPNYHSLTKAAILTYFAIKFFKFTHAQARMIFGTFTITIGHTLQTLLRDWPLVKVWRLTP
jgi:hypothetical protein